MLKKEKLSALYCAIALFVTNVAGQSQTEVHYNGFRLRSTPCVKVDANVLKRFYVVKTSPVTSLASCMVQLGTTSVKPRPHSALVSGHPDMTSFQCHLMTSSSDDATDDVLTIEEVNREDEKPFCSFYIPKHTLGQGSLCNGVDPDAPTIVWSSDLDTWVDCDNVKDGGGWTVIQRRQDGSVDFYRTWQEYKDGFGSPAGELWLGLDNIRRLLATGSHQLRVDMTKEDGTQYFAVYDHFEIADEANWYRLSVGSYSGNAGDGLSAHDGSIFETKDHMNTVNGKQCPVLYQAAFWYFSCHHVHLNGVYGSQEFGKGIIWAPLTGFSESLLYVDMKIRPILLA